MKKNRISGDQKTVSRSVFYFFIFCSLILLTNLSFAATLDSATISSGGGIGITSGPYTLQDIKGQAVIGESTSGTTTISVGGIYGTLDLLSLWQTYFTKPKNNTGINRFYVPLVDPNTTASSVSTTTPRETIDPEQGQPIDIKTVKGLIQEINRQTSQGDPTKPTRVTVFVWRDGAGQWNGLTAIPVSVYNLDGTINPSSVDSIKTIGVADPNDLNKKSPSDFLAALIKSDFTYQANVTPTSNNAPVPADYRHELFEMKGKTEAAGRQGTDTSQIEVRLNANEAKDIILPFIGAGAESTGGNEPAVANIVAGQTLVPITTVQSLITAIGQVSSLHWIDVNLTDPANPRIEQKGVSYNSDGSVAPGASGLSDRLKTGIPYSIVAKVPRYIIFQGRR